MPQPKHNLKALLSADVQKSGFTLITAEKLGFKCFSADELSELTGYPPGKIGPGYAIPYFSFEKKYTGFTRYKLFTPMKMKTGFMRYYQEPKSLVKLYIPQLPTINWKKVLADPTYDVVCCEGEKKAASLCALGIPCVSVPGVWAWGSRRLQQPLLPEFSELGNRTIVVCFDSDSDSNSAIQGALATLANELSKKGIVTKVCRLPARVDGVKVGLDDFLVANKKDPVKAFMALEKTVPGLQCALQEINNELIFVEKQMKIFHLPSQLFIRIRDLVDSGMADRKVQITNRNGQFIESNLAKEWSMWTNRRRIKELVYVPGQAPLAELPDRTYNLWTGWGVEPKRGDTKLFDELVDYLATDLTAEQKKWWLQWMAYPIQNPGTKLYSACVLYSSIGGVGKTLLAYTLRDIYGANGQEVDSFTLHGDFNDWARNKQFIIGDELTSVEHRRADGEHLKSLITRDTVRINEKNQPAYALQDCCNYLLTTNHSDAVPIDEGDRRYFVIDIRTPPLNGDFYDKYQNMYLIKKGGSPAAIFYKLQHMDLTNFKPEKAPPITAAKEEMKYTASSEPERLMRDFLDDPDSKFRSSSFYSGKRELFKMEEIRDLLDPNGRTSVSLLSRAYKRIIKGFKEIIIGNPAKRLYAVKNIDYWMHKTDHKIRLTHYEETLNERQFQKESQKAKIKAIPKSKANGNAKRIH